MAARRFCDGIRRRDFLRVGSAGLFGLGLTLPRLLERAQRVFVTLRDSRGGPWASEGLLTGSVLDPPRPDPNVIRRPAARVFQRLAVTR